VNEFGRASTIRATGRLAPRVSCWGWDSWWNSWRGNGKRRTAAVRL